jgi:hypothetical protein
MENSGILTDLTDLTENGQTRGCPEHGLSGLLREGNKLICGLCLGMPAERLEILRKREGNIP